MGTLRHRLDAEALDDLVVALADHRVRRGRAWAPELLALEASLAAIRSKFGTDVAMEVAVGVAGADDAGDAPLTYAAAARMMDTSTRTLRRMVADGRLAPVIVGRRPRFRRADLIAYLEGS